MNRRAAALFLVLIALASAGARAQEPPRPVDTGRYLLGAQMCPLWNDEQQWKAIRPFPERMPLLGWYDEGSPTVTDWEAKWALDHGISFFLVCWYRAKDQPGPQPVRARYEHWLRGLKASRYGAQLKFAIQWENVNDNDAGAASEEDLLRHLLPYWIENFFRQPNYLQVDGKPVFAIYHMNKFVADLGGEEESAAALRKMREACAGAGFKGLVVLSSQCWGAPEPPVEQMQRVGADFTYAYHLPTFEAALGADLLPSARVIMDAQESAWRQPLALPRIVSVSVGWDATPWGGMGSARRWKLSPADFKQLCRRARAVVDERPGTGLETRMILIDAWNEYGEGHFIFPTKEHRFGYLDAIREVFSPAAPPHEDDAP